MNILHLVLLTGLLVICTAQTNTDSEGNSMEPGEDAQEMSTEPTEEESSTQIEDSKTEESSSSDSKMDVSDSFLARLPKLFGLPAEDIPRK